MVTFPISGSSFTIQNIKIDNKHKTYLEHITVEECVRQLKVLFHLVIRIIIIIGTAVLTDALKFHLKVRVWIIFEWGVSAVDYHQ